jgi:hypothetical protein
LCGQETNQKKLLKKKSGKKRCLQGSKTTFARQAVKKLANEASMVQNVN